MPAPIFVRICAAAAACLGLLAAGPGFAQSTPLAAAGEANRLAAAEVARAASAVQAAGSAITQAQAAASAAEKVAAAANDKPAEPGALARALGAVEQSSGRVYAFVAVLVAVSTLAMALTEFVKALSDLRRFFHARCVRRWLGRSHGEALRELLFLAIGDEADDAVLYGQELSKMMGQIQAAARVALDYPEQYPALYAFLSSSGERGRADATRWLEQASVLAGSRSEPVDAAQAAQARARLANLASRKLDAFQLRTEYWWARLCQVLATVISIGVMWQALAVALPTSEAMERVLLGLLGGLVAPFMRDLTSAITSLKQGARK